MKRLVLGVIGHVDHGKTALVRALTGTDTDRLPEEKQRGISITLGFAHLDVDGAVVDLIDMPGHERFVRTMIAGATGIGAVLLVVAANEGIKPQTIEHTDIASLLGLRRAVVAITKVDLVTAAEAERVAREVAQLLERARIAPLTPVMTSVLNDQGFDQLRGRLTSMAHDQPVRASDGLAFLPIDRTFSMTGHGPVVTGTLRGADISTGDTLELLPARRRVRVRGLQVHGAAVERACPGQRVALNLRDVDIDELQRGMALAAPDTLSPTQWLTVSLRAVDTAPTLNNGMRLRALFGTTEVDARLRLLDGDALEAGHEAIAQLHCSEAVALPTGEHMILRLVSPPQTIAGGKVLETDTRRRRRHDAEIIARLVDLSALPPERAIAAEVFRAGAVGTTLRYLSRLSARASSQVIAILESQPIIVTRSGLVVATGAFDQVLGRIPALLASQPAGLNREQLASALRGVGLPVLDEALARLTTRGTVCQRGNQFLIPRPDEDAARARDEAELTEHLAETLQRAGLTPPNPGDIVTSAAAKRAIDRLIRERTVVRAVDRAKGREMLFHREAIDTAQARLSPLLDQPPGLLVTEIATALGISRKFCMPLLDHLDGIGFTRRIDDRRVRAARGSTRA